MSLDRLAFATQGNEFSWHAEAARQAAGTSDIDIVDLDDFSHVITAAIDRYPGLGVMAINTAAGTVEGSARRFVGRRSAALPPIVDRVDLSIGLSLIGSVEQSIEELNRPGVTCYLQEEAQLQIDGFKRDNLQQLHYERRKESTRAVHEALGKQSPNHIAVGPSYSAEMMGGFVLGPKQINPEGSVTSFYVLQRNPKENILPDHPERTAKVSVIGLNYPEAPNELEKCLDAMDKVGLRPVRFIPYRNGHPTKHNPDIKKNGGILEVQHDQYDPEVPKFCSKVNSLKGDDGVDGPFDAKRLGEYDWYPQEILDLSSFLD